MAYYHCLLLDVDGTMMDFAAAEHKAFHETMSEFGLPATDEVEHTYHTINKGLWAGGGHFHQRPAAAAAGGADPAV